MTRVLSRTEDAPASAAPARGAVGGLAVLGTALAVTVVTFVLGAAFVLTRPPVWTASASFAVLPESGDAQTQAGYYETLSRGQIVSTIAEVMSAQAQVLPADVDTEVEVLPETSFIRLTARADSADAATGAAQAQLEAGVAAVSALRIPFEPRTVELPAQTVERVSADRVKGLAVVALGALGAGLLVQQSLAALTRQRRRPRRQRHGADAVRSSTATGD